MMASLGDMLANSITRRDAVELDARKTYWSHLAVLEEVVVAGQEVKAYVDRWVPSDEGNVIDALVWVGGNVYRVVTGNTAWIGRVAENEVGSVALELDLIKKEMKGEGSWGTTTFLLSVVLPAALRWSAAEDGVWSLDLRPQLSQEDALRVAAQFMGRPATRRE
jgi:hypothetical protein